MITTIPNLLIPGIDRPVTPPEVGAKTAQAILDIVRLHPENHDQRDWVVENRVQANGMCNTTLCVAGWAQWLHEGNVCDAESGTRDVEHAAAEYLDISFEDADYLFYHCTDAGAVAALEYLVRGEPIDWDAVDEFNDDEDDDTHFCEDKDCDECGVS